MEYYSDNFSLNSLDYLVGKEFREKIYERARKQGKHQIGWIDEEGEHSTIF